MLGRYTLIKLPELCNYWSNHMDKLIVFVKSSYHSIVLNLVNNYIFINLLTGQGTINAGESTVRASESIIRPGQIFKWRLIL